jgi:hypothetical protein
MDFWNKIKVMMMIVPFMFSNGSRQMECMFMGFAIGIHIFPI